MGNTLTSAPLAESRMRWRAICNVRAAVEHVAMTPNTYIVAGRLGLGLEPGNARF